MRFDLLDEVVLAVEFAFSGVALLVQQTSTNEASNTLRMPQVIENVRNELIVHWLRAAETLTGRSRHARRAKTPLQINMGMHTAFTFDWTAGQVWSSC